MLQLQCNVAAYGLPVVLSMPLPPAHLLPLLLLLCQTHRASPPTVTLDTLDKLSLLLSDRPLSDIRGVAGRL
jgi:hypothetical protein